MEDRCASASGRVAVLEESRWRRRLERSVEGGREAAAVASARAAGAWEASARRSGSRRSMASWSWDAVATETEKVGRFMQREAEHDGMHCRRGETNGGDQGTREEWQIA